MTPPAKRHRLRAAAAILATLAIASTTVATAHASPAGESSTTYGKSQLARDLRSVVDDGVIGAQGEVGLGSHRIVATAGVADRKTRQKMPANGYFRAASNTKTFTATVALQLVGEGKLSLDDTVERWLPGVVQGNGNDGNRVTVRDLLRQTSGLADFSDDVPALRSEKDYLAHRFDHFELADIAAGAMKRPPNFYPDGKRWEYSNTNYILATMVVEKVTGNDWYTEVQNRILTPLGLANTFPARDYPYVPKPSAHSYERFGDGQPLVDVSAFNLSVIKGVGDLITTTEDLNTFFAALTGGKLLEPAQWAEMTKTVKADTFEELLPIGGYRYGLGLSWNPLTCGSGYWGHGGDGAGFTSRAGRTPDGRSATLYTSTTLFSVDLHRKLLKALDTALCNAPKATATTAASTSAYGKPDLAGDLRKVVAAGVTGVQGEARSGDRRVVATAGVADLESRKKMPENGSFRAASHTKTFTATIILQLVGEGKLSLDDTVERWLPGVVAGNGNDGGKVTVRQLLQHTSGIPDYAGDVVPHDAATWRRDRFKHWDLEDVVEVAMKHEPSFEPGTKWEYSNTNYALATMIVQKVTGQDWYDELDRRILRPLRLNDTFSPRDNPYLPRPHATGYTRFEENGPLVDTTAFNSSGGKGAGDLVSTTKDLTSFYTALAGGKLLKPAQWAEMTKTVKSDAFEDVLPIGGYRYGLGLSWNPLTCGGGYWGHGGDLPGFSSRVGATSDGRSAGVYASTWFNELEQDRLTLKAIDRALCETPSPKYGRSAFQNDLDAIHDLGVSGVQGRVDTGKRTLVGESGGVDTDGYFRLGSVTKPMVATVMLQLVAEGKVGLEDTVEHWLPGVVQGNGNDGSKVTVRQLLQHTSGIHSYTSELPLGTEQDYYAHRFDHYDSEDLVAIALKHQPDFAPGTKWSYNNTGYVLAGMIIEKVTGNPWDTEVQNRVFNKLAMRDTFAPGDYPYLPGVHAKGYQQYEENGKLVDVTVYSHSWANAAGAHITTAADLEKFWHGLFGGRLLKPAQLAEMKKARPAEDFWDVWPGARYGLGLMWVPHESGGGYWGHGGDTLGFKTRSGITADGRQSMVLSLSTQLGGPESDQLVNRLANRALRP